jgi:hypothetical protein
MVINVENNGELDQIRQSRFLKKQFTKTHFVV